MGERGHRVNRPLSGVVKLDLVGTIGMGSKPQKCIARATSRVERERF